LIYGSFAKGSESSSSDIDMLIIGSVEEDSILKSTEKIERRIGRTINFVLWTEKEFETKIHDNITLIREILKTPIIMIIGDEYELKRTIEQRSS
jgi:predicted nucleotidyltransferase